MKRANKRVYRVGVSRRAHHGPQNLRSVCEIFTEEISFLCIPRLKGMSCPVFDAGCQGRFDKWIFILYTLMVHLARMSGDTMVLESHPIQNQELEA